MRLLGQSKYARLMSGAAFGALLLASGSAYAQDNPAVPTSQISIAAQPLATALYEYGTKTGRQVMFTPDVVTPSKLSSAVVGASDEEVALRQMLAGTGLTFSRRANMIVIQEEGGSGPQSGSAVGGGAEVEALIVTAQKREEDIQDVPIAISAFSQEALERSQVAGGPDLMTQVPNMTFTKTNFSSYSIQIRGIGTQAISATTDAAVAVALNNSSFIRNRFFEQEFYDLQRVEVLRGPQGTLYGRNATAGVVNIISAKPTFNEEAKASADVANFNTTRLEGMVNIPLVEDAVALRLAGAWTKRDGYATNQLNGNPIDGRDLWSTRLSLRFVPSDQIEANLIWEHFEEDDGRLRSGKQLCKTDVTTRVGGIPVDPTTGWVNTGNDLLFSRAVATINQGCAPASLYSPESFQTPNGMSLPYYLPLGAIFLPTALDDPYVNRSQSHDLRVIESTIDPEYRAESDLAEIQLNIDVADDLTLTSETAYLADDLFSLEDYNRFNTAPGAWTQPTGGFGERPGVFEAGPNGGIFCDPQLGCTDRLIAVDVSSAKSRQFSQEFRLSSNYDGAFNFSVGGNFLRYDTEDKYYVFINSLSLIAAISPFANVKAPYVGGVTDNRECLLNGPVAPDFTKPQVVTWCTYMDPNPIGSLNDQGHNYFLSRNPYKLLSYAAFGEAYYNVTDTLKITAGLRFTVDKKEAPRIPSWVLASDSVGLPITEVVRQEWKEPTGRLTIDWKPNLSFTDETLLYASLARGYKAGGANPPPMGVVCYGCGEETQGLIDKSASHPKTFNPEFVHAFEVGAKSTLFDGRLTLNTSGFYYDYSGYQISQIVNRSAVNLNFDAEVWGMEIEADWRPIENLRLGFKGGYEGTRVADGEQAIDLMDRTAGHSDWIVHKPFPTFASNCILPLSLFERPGGLYRVGNIGGGGPGGCEIAYVLGLDPVTEQEYQPVHITDRGFSAENPYLGFDPASAPNNGEGFFKELGGNELPNAPTFTTTITADYTIPMPSDWLMTLHTDLYYQSEAWTRIFNMEGYDKLKAYTNVNLAAIFTNEEAGWKMMAYVKNVMDRDSITGAFLNSDDTGLTTNVFLTEPRLYGLRVTKEWTGGSLLGSFRQRRDPNRPYALAVELGGQAQRHDAPYETVRPSFSSMLSPTLDTVFDTSQNQELDWGDGREVKLTYRPVGSPWLISFAARAGETNRGRRFLASEVGDRGCFFSAPCPESDPTFNINPFTGTNYADGEVTDHEEHAFVDLVVGRDVGLGYGLGSRISAGLRHADVESSTHLTSIGIPDWQIPDTFTWTSPSQHHVEESDLATVREFSGTGPIVTWDASKQLFGSDEAGHIDIDWSVEGGVLFGKQRTFVAGEEESSYFSGSRYYNYAWTSQVGETVSTPVATSRSEVVTVPLVAISAGLSYEIQRVELSAGYRWERYFDVLDVGVDEAKDANRTIAGPYFKIAVGFGG